MPLCGTRYSEGPPRVVDASSLAPTTTTQGPRPYGEMADEEMHYESEDDEEVEDYPFDEGIDTIPDHFNRPSNRARAPPIAQQPLPGPAGAGGFNPFSAMRGMLGGMGAHFAAGGGGYGGHPFGMRPADSYNAVFTAYSTAILEVQEGKGGARHGMAGSGRDNVNFGGKILMPPSALQALSDLEIEGPWMFTLTNPHDVSVKTHAGVLEFIAAEGLVHLPHWMMQRLRLSEGDRLRIKGARLPKGKFIKLQPQSVDFLELSDPKAVLENALRNFACLTQGDIIEIAHNNINFSFLIMEAQPSADGISVIDTDLEVDFAPPVGYVEPTPQPRAPAPTMASKLGIKTSATTAQTQSSNAGAFTGSGNSLGGKRVKGKGFDARKIEAVASESRILRTDRPRVMTADTPDATSRVPAALNLPFGTLFFGYPVVPLGDSTNVAATAEQVSAPVPFAAAGQGASLSGRIRSDARASPSPASPPPKPKATDGPFSGQGHALNGR